MAVKNSCVFTVQETPDRWDTCQEEVCFSDVFYTAKKNRYVLAYFRLDPNDISRKDADWFVKEVIKELPKSVIEALRFRRAWGKFAREWEEAPSSYHDYEEDHKPIISSPWFRISIDGSKVSGTMILCLLTFLRYPQEFPEIALEVKKLMIAFPRLAFSKAFWIASAGGEHGGHQVLHGGNFVELEKKLVQYKQVFESYSLASYFNNLVENNKTPFVQNQRHDNVSKYFSEGMGDAWLFKIKPRVYKRFSKRGINKISCYLMNLLFPQKEENIVKREPAHGAA